MAAAAAGVEKALARINTQIDAGAYYEAQQMFKTAYHRYRSRKQLQEAYLVLQEGSIMQLKKGQITCGLELASMLVQAYSTDGVGASTAAVQGILQVVSALPPPPPGSSGEAELAECSRFVVAALKWATKSGAHEAAAQLHARFGTYIWEAYGWRQFSKASMHLARGSDAGAFAAVLAACCSLVAPEERDMVLARGLLQTLACAQRSSTREYLMHAQALLAACRQAMMLDTQLWDSPLTHFMELLLQALERESHQLFVLLRAKYSPSLQRDPCLEPVLSKVEAMYFGLEPPGQGGGLLGNLLRGLLEGDEAEA